jgi:hypothetical protein
MLDFPAGQRQALVHADVFDANFARVFIRRISDFFVVHPPADAAVGERLSRVAFPRFDFHSLELPVHRLQIFFA